MVDFSNKEFKVSSVIESLLKKYNPVTLRDYENALKEVIQEITLAGLARSQFFDKAAFYGGTALRIFYGLPRFSEDLDFTLLSSQGDFTLKNYFSSVSTTLGSFGLSVEIEDVEKSSKTIESAFLKTNTKMLFLNIGISSELANRIQSNQKLSIKFEVDTAPPLGFETEVKVLLPPITASIKVLKPSSLFAGKVHAILFREWKKRVKGRDFYDLLWYLGQRVPVKLIYLENKMRDGGQWSGNQQLKKEDVLMLLEDKIKSIDWENAKQDVIRFVKDPEEIKVWSSDFFSKAILDLRFE